MSAVRQRLFSRNFGSGPRKVLALHCTLAHSGAWRGVAEAMEADVTFVTPDLLTHGRSPDWNGRGDYQSGNMEAIEPLLNEPMDVVGHSFGATVALRLALEYPDRVRSLTMIEPVFFGIVAIDDPDMFAAQSGTEAEYLTALKAGDDELAARLFNRSWGESRVKWPDMRPEMRAAMTRSINVVLASRPALIDDVHGQLKPGVLDRANMPTLLLRGSLSPKSIQIVNDGLARRLPDAVCKVVEGAGHMVPVTHPSQTADTLRDLFGRVPV